MVTKNVPKNNKNFYCEECDYKCSKKSVYNKHLMTLKHKKRTNGYKKCSTPFKCDCGTIFKYRQGLYRHKLICSENVPTDINNESVPNMINSLLKDNIEFKETIIKNDRDRNKLHKKSLCQQEAIFKLQNELIEIVKAHPTVVNNTNVTNYNNQRFNLNIFLNEQCKDAMNISEFINSLELEPYDIAETGRLGYVEGISRIVVNRLNQMDVYNRPLHYTDLKRETIYIKDDDKWDKDNDRKDKLNNIVKKVAERNYEQLPVWQQQHPEHAITDTPACEMFMDIVCNSLGGCSGTETNKFTSRIMRNIIKEITIDKYET